MNPFLCFVSGVKTNLDIMPAEVDKHLEPIKERLRNYRPTTRDPTDSNISSLFANESAFTSLILNKVLFVNEAIVSVQDRDAQEFLKLALCSIVVEVSNYRRGPDLAKKKHKMVDAPVFERFLENTSRMMTDLRNVERNKLLKPLIVCGDSRNLDLKESLVDLVITSPPYLNGTNYFRNTKLELWLIGRLNTRQQLHDFRTAAVTAGINDVFKSKSVKKHSVHASQYVEAISKSPYDERI